MKKPKVYVIEDDPGILGLLTDLLERLQYRVCCSPHGGDLFPTLEADDRPNVVLLDIVLPGRDGVSLLKKIRRVHEEIPVIMITGHGTIDKAVECMQLGAYDFLTKPFDLTRLEIALKNAVAFNRLSRKYSNLESLNEPYQFEEMIGVSAPMQTIYRIIKNVSKSDATVFVMGESGTGKELVARAIHQRSRRANRPFVAINSAAIPRELLESELFGHEKGAFTGAYQQRIGSCEAADGGTLFLDEICDMPPELQVKLLRFLQDHSFHRIGGREQIRVDVRVIAATNRDPTKEVERATLREDLYYRLFVVPIEVPVLRERKEDIPLLAMHFLEEFATRNGKRFSEFSPEAIKALVNYTWPGNVRELMHMVEQVVVLHNKEVVGLNLLPPRIGDFCQPADVPEVEVSVDHIAEKEGRILPFAEVERRTIEGALRLCQGNVAAAAKRLEISPATIYRKIKRYGIEV